MTLVNKHDNKGRKLDVLYSGWVFTSTFTFAFIFIYALLHYHIVRHHIGILTFHFIKSKVLLLFLHKKKEPPILIINYTGLKTIRERIENTS